MGELNALQVDNMIHSLKNQNRFYTEENDSNWNDLVSKGYATKHPGWEDDMAYFRVTELGKEALVK